MDSPIVKVKVAAHGRGIPIPQYMSEGAAGADLRAAVDAELTIMPGETVLVPTGLFLEIPPGFELQVRSRSGLALNHSITLPNSPATIDSDYRGELGVIMHNLGKKPFTIKRGDRIAQAVVARVSRAEFVEAELGETKRGAGSFGSTGKQ